MNETQQAAQLEMFMRRVVCAESALRTMQSVQFKDWEQRELIKRTLRTCEQFTDDYVKRYPDCAYVNP